MPPWVGPPGPGGPGCNGARCTYFFRFPGMPREKLNRIGSCVPDHSASRPGNWPGRNILLVPEFTEYECLKAYRGGRFYGCLHDCGLKVTDVTASYGRVWAEYGRRPVHMFIDIHVHETRITGLSVPREY